VLGPAHAGGRDDGNSTVEFVLVSTLLVALLLVVLQVGFVLHTRTVLVAAAQEGARYGANADRDVQDARRRTHTAVATALSPAVAARMSYQAEQVARDGLVTVQVTVRGPLPLVFLPAGPLQVTASGHALSEGP
jgi:Flp pilus assembly protein TadG